MTELASTVAETGHMVPDGTVPFALPAYLEGIGVKKGETTEAAAGIVAAMCDAVHWMELTRAKETAVQLEALKSHSIPRRVALVWEEIEELLVGLRYCCKK